MALPSASDSQDLLQRPRLSRSASGKQVFVADSGAIEDEATVDGSSASLSEIDPVAATSASVTGERKSPAVVRSSPPGALPLPASGRAFTTAGALSRDPAPAPAARRWLGPLLGAGAVAILGVGVFEMGWLRGPGAAPSASSAPIGAAAAPTPSAAAPEAPRALPDAPAIPAVTAAASAATPSASASAKRAPQAPAAHAATAGPTQTGTPSSPAHAPTAGGADPVGNGLY